MTGEEVFNIRKRLGLTQAQLAHEIGTSVVSVSRWENNKSSPILAYVKALEKLVKHAR